MDTMHARIRVALHHIDRRTRSSNIGEISTEIRERQLEEFRVRVEGESVDDYMRSASIREQLHLMEDLGLIEISEDGIVSLNSAGRRSLASDDAFDRQIQSCVKTLLQDQGLPLHRIVERIEEIELPNVPDSDTIYDGFENVEHSIGRDTLRTLLFLYACAGGIDRVMRVHYRPQQ